MRVENAAAYPQFIERIARWHWNEWGAADTTASLEAWTARLRRRANRDRVPMTLVAVDRLCTPIGSVSIIEHDMPDRTDLRHLTPWIAGTFVVEAERGKGVGAALMRHAVAEARRVGATELFLYTSSARRFYERLGWTVVRKDFYEGEPVTIMVLRLEPDFASPL